MLLHCMCRQGIQNVLSSKTNCPYPNPMKLSRLNVLLMLFILIIRFNQFMLVQLPPLDIEPYPLENKSY
jgi:hypothetical protein